MRPGLRLVWLSLLPLLFADPRLPAAGGAVHAGGISFRRGARGLGRNLVQRAGGVCDANAGGPVVGGRSRSRGRAYAMNVVGSILGPLVAGFGGAAVGGRTLGIVPGGAAAVRDRIRDGFWRGEPQAAVCGVRGGIAAADWFSRRITAQSFRTASNCAITRRR